MKWFDRWFARKWRWAYATRDEIELVALSGAKAARPVPQDIATEDWEDGLRITIKKMIGGSVVSFRTYDRRTDRSESRHYIITDNEDFTTELGKIITMESMRQTL
jgi:hypothetical protein